MYNDGIFLSDFDDTNPFGATDSSDEVFGIALTEFHLLILYSDRLKAVCTLNEQVVFEDVYPARSATPCIAVLFSCTLGHELLE